jgi:hypothetical protein
VLEEVADQDERSHLVYPQMRKRLKPRPRKLIWWEIILKTQMNHRMGCQVSYQQSKKSSQL